MAHDLMRRCGLGTTLAAALGGAAVLAAPAPAAACGGLFCSSANPVNQAAEQIVFSDNGDGTVTAIIQIMYQGPAHEFAWVLPVAGNPTVGVSSSQAIDALKQATNPLYQLQTVMGDSCSGQFGIPASVSTGAGGTGGGGSLDNGGGVNVLASGAIGPYVYDVIMVNPSASDEAQVAIDWLTDNSYDLGDLGADVLRPYLQDGLNLIAFKLDPQSDAGAIRPVMITYEATQPSIPIRPTAVAANDDMGVMVFLLSDKRGIPENYRALELNEALIDWFNPNNNYNQVVTAAADEAAGQGFVTEFAGTIDGTSGPLVEVFAQWQRDNWTNFQSTQHTDPVQMVQDANNQWAGYDGLEEAIAGAVTLPDTITLEDFKNCMTCYLGEPGVVFDTTAYLTQLYQLVVKPLIETQDLLDARPYMTRLYTTMSAREMTMDPVFAFNADLDVVSNNHTATRTIECTESDPFGSNSPWTVELTTGTIIAGDQPNVWPVDSLEDLPAAAKILQLTTAGQGEILEDNPEMIADALSALSGGTPTPNDPTPNLPTKDPTPDDPTPNGPVAGSGSSPLEPGADPGSSDFSEMSTKGDGGCSATGRNASSTLWTLGLAIAALVRRRRATA